MLIERFCSDVKSVHLVALVMRVLATALIVMLFSAAPTRGQTPSATVESYRRVDQGLEYTGSFSDIAFAVDAFWMETLAKEGITYQSPGVEALDRVRTTGCGTHGPEGAAFYCQRDQTIYLSPTFLIEHEEQIGDYAPIVVLAHEWGHHIQHLLLIPDQGGNSYELQADCLAGAYTLDAEEDGLLEPGDFIEALQMSEKSGDPIWFPQDAPGAHGTYADRAKSVMRGYLDGVAGCNLFQPGHTPTPPSIPTPTSPPAHTPVPKIDPTPTPTRVVGTENPRLPESLPLGHAACFRVESNDVLTFDDLLGRLGGTEEAQQHLVDWGWMTSVNRTFACDTPPNGEAGWVDVSVHLFGSTMAAQQAVDYFATVRAEETSLITVDSLAIGDYATSLSGPTSNGKEFTIYASQGPVLLRVTGVSPTGIPFDNVLTVARAVLAIQLPESQSSSIPIEPPSAMSIPASAYLPAYPAVNYAECFHVYDSGSYNYDEVVDALETTGLNREQVDGLGWQDGAYVVFSCADPPVGRASQLDVVIHQFSNSQGALPYFDQTYVPGVNETRACNNVGTLIVCVTGRSLTGSPLTDVHFVLNQVLAAAR